MKRKSKCTQCNGKGFIGQDRSCPVCNGTGGKEKGIRCYNCLGWGIITLGGDKRCPSCNGKGYQDWIDKIRRPVTIVEDRDL